MIGRLIDGRYQVRSRIARGGMATVYLATDLRLERRVAVKIMHGHLADDNQFKLRFIQEARSAARLAHPNVVNVFDQGQDADSAYLVMEYLPGITLRDLLHDYGALTAEQTIDITEAVLSGLAAAHKAGIVHRDLKPENVLLADDGRIKIGDFGLARAASANTATGAALLGTIAYLSPELVTRGIADARSDVYAVGIMMFEMLTGEQPFKGEQPMQIAYQHANEQVPAPGSKNDTVPAELDQLVLWATARDPDERPRDARALLDQVRDTDSQLQTALLPSRTTAQRTLVLPVAERPIAERAAPADAETQVLGTRAGAPPRPPSGPGHPAGPGGSGVPDRTAALATVAKKRRGRAWIAVVLVILLVLAAGGTGWWFGFGPGARTTVPGVAGQSVDEARAALVAQGFQVADEVGQVASLDIAAGLVAETDPAIGSSVANGSEITLLASSGPQLIALPGLVGIPEAEATDLAGQNWSVQDPLRRFDSEVPEGTVIDAYGVDAAGTTISLTTITEYGEQQPITLDVSAGPLPEVAGQSVDDATDVLRDAGLVVDGTLVEQADDSVPEGDVVGVVTLNEDGSGKIYRIGDTIALIVSTGPPPVVIPDVNGQTWNEAKRLLEEAGLVAEPANGRSETLANLLPDNATVSGMKPGAGETVRKGDTVKIDLNF